VAKAGRAPAARFRGGGSSGNRVNVTPTTDLTRVSLGSKRARRGKRQRG
jgi:hypothetical protein